MISSKHKIWVKTTSSNSNDWSNRYKSGDKGFVDGYIEEKFDLFAIVIIDNRIVKIATCNIQVIEVDEEEKLV